MNVNVNDVVTVMAITGEYVGKVKEVSETSITLEDPRMVHASQNGMGFANGIVATGVKDPKEVTLRNYVFIAETNPDVVKSYREMVSGIVLANSGIQA